MLALPSAGTKTAAPYRSVLKGWGGGHVTDGAISKLALLSNSFSQKQPRVNLRRPNVRTGTGRQGGRDGRRPVWKRLPLRIIPGQAGQDIWSQKLIAQRGESK